ncbi:heparinase II/III domain-containing protein [Flavobacterium quisquiliarum]|uniref:Heparinase II/III family protein n=1 Tax=Flavobacterium quisquiliarum TaxID=1834436 RepID=A0ABV8W2V8_9FLAO|nr:heparinase II/III family protein [Flavobacterium quisquiliarum]MBW1654261.1 heparinase [Flavobacterium quisquiliarum]NWL03304.1 heparinase [Flavobacterium collinsii]
MKNKVLILLAFTILLLVSENAIAQSHPRLVLTKKGAAEIKANLGKAPLFDSSLREVKKEVDAEIALGIEVPIPKDFSGGYTHERHKKNFLIVQKAGFLYQILGDKKYAVYVKEMLMAYAKLYPTLPLHPQERSYARGKLFWQALNDANWLVYTSQAYDCVYDFIGAADRAILEKELFRPFADFISIGSPQFFNRVHNHSTWGNVAVGMIALVMDDAELLDRALNGLKEDGLPAGMKDNDGGLIKQEGQKTGFLANVDEPFSPDGYYNEGPYYQRYAMYPFLVFAEALQNTKPDLKIFEYKKGILIKSVYALLNLTNSEGEFFPLNDGQKGMSYYSRELVSSVDIAYLYGGKDASLLSIAEKQGRVQLDNAGMAVALAVKNKLAKPFIKKSIDLSDGQDGNQGGVAVIRNKSKDDELTLVMKYTSQGSSHGHFDKLSFSYYNNDSEILQDYGLARFVNIEQKGGGNYLKENETWAKQTIAHNTIIQNETSHFKGDFEIGDKFSSKRYFFDSSNPKIQIISAIEDNAYPNTKMHRTMALLEIDGYEKPLLLDIFQVKSNTPNQYDLPFYYLGQMMTASFKYETPKTLESLGKSFGYQHLWKEGFGKAGAENIKFSWLDHVSFYTLTSVTQQDDELLLVSLGANDPNFNLRRDAGLIIRKKNVQQASYINVIETHGSYSTVTEAAINASSSIITVEKVYEDENYIGVSIKNKNGTSFLFVFATANNSVSEKHTLEIKGTTYSWVGTYFSKVIK